MCYIFMCYIIYHIHYTVFIVPRNIPTIAAWKNKILLNYPTKRGTPRAKATDAFQIKLTKASISTRCSAVRRTRTAVRDPPNSSFCARHAYGGKWRLKRRRRFFVGSTRRKNKKGSGAIQFAFRRSCGLPNTGWEKCGRAKQKGTKGWQGILWGEVHVEDRNKIFISLFAF